MTWGLDEREQIRIDLIFMSRAHAVRQAGIDFQRGALNDLGGKHGRGAGRHDLVMCQKDKRPSNHPGLVKLARPVV